VSVRSRDSGHDRAVRDPQAVDAVHLKCGIHDRHAIDAHLARPDEVIIGADIRHDPVAQLRVGRDRGPGADLLQAKRGESACSVDVARDLHHRHDTVDVDRLRPDICADIGRDGRVGALQSHPAARQWAHQSRQAEDHVRIDQLGHRLDRLTGLQPVDHIGEEGVAERCAVHEADLKVGNRQAGRGAPEQPDLRHIATRIGTRLRHPAERADDQRMVLKVFADARQIDAHIDPVPAELVGRTDAGQHQQLGRFDRAAGDDHLAAAAGRNPLAVLQVLDPDAAVIFEQQSGRARSRLQGDISARHCRLQIGGEHAATPAVPKVEMVPTATERRSIEVVDQRIAELDARVEKHLRDRIPGVLGVDDRDGSALARGGVGVVELVFQPLEIRQAILEGPAIAAVIGPVVEIARPCAHMHHVV
jgi:hypothetical protein